MRIKKITRIPDFPLPSRATDGSAAYDLCAGIEHQIALWPDCHTEIGTGYAWEIPPGYAGILLPRSGLGSKGLVLRNTAGLIDQDFRNEIVARVKNTGHSVITIEPKQRFAQLLIVPVHTPALELVDELSATARGNGGFGSTGN